MVRRDAVLVVIVTESVIEGCVIRLIKSLGVTGYSVFRDVTGEGNRGVRSGSGGLGDFAANVRIETVVLGDEMAEKIMDGVCEEYFGNYAGIVYSTDIRVLRSAKFAAVEH